MSTCAAVMRPGVRLGIDVGEVRVGLAVCDPDGLIATAVQTLRRDHAELHDIDQIVDEARTRDVVEVVVGLPLGLDGAHGIAAGRARGYAQALCRRLDRIPVRLWDERLTTVDAHRGLRMSGVPTRRHRESVDQVAAALILQTALDAERTTGVPNGEIVTARKARHRATSREQRGRQP